MRGLDRVRRLPNWAVGLIAVVFITLGVLWAFTKSIPFTPSYEVKAVFESAQNLAPNSQVRIAGVQVGKVTTVEPLAGTEGVDEDATVNGGGAVVTMEIKDEGRPIRQDSTFQLRPRLFLEGNLFVELRPGSPASPEVDDGHVFDTSRTSYSVQLDQLLTTLQSNVRKDLQVLLAEFGTALEGGGAEGLRELYRTSPGAYRATSQVNDAFLGYEPHDVSELIGHLDTVVAALGENEEALQGAVTNLDTFLGSFAAQSESLRSAVAELPGVLAVGRPALASLNDALPSLRAFSREALPGTRSAPEALDAALPLVRQLAGWSRPSELRGLAANLREGDARPLPPQQADDPVPRAGPLACELRQRGDHPVQQHGGAERDRLPVGSRRQDLRGGRLRPRRHQRREPLGRRQRPVHPGRGRRRHQHGRVFDRVRRHARRHHPVPDPRRDAGDRLLGEDAV